MKLLFDQNLSHKLPINLRDLFPSSAHVKDFHLTKADDTALWTHAKRDQFAIVTKDEDFPELAFLRGHPPKVIWIQLGNCSTGQVESLIRWRAGAILAFLSDPDLSVLSLT